MEIPEKIYLSYEHDDKDHIFIDYMWHRHPFEGKNLTNVEYTRTDTLINNACEFLNNNLPLYFGQDNADNTDRFVRIFRKAMEEQQ